MKHEEAVKLLDQIETSLVRAEEAKKDIETIVLLRLAYEILKERVKNGTSDS